MKAVARLVATSFTATEWLAWICGAALMVVAFTALNKFSFSSILSLQALGFVSLGAFFLGSMMMPSMFSRLALSHSIDLLPHGRLKLLTSTLVIILIVSLHVPVAFIAIMNTAAPNGLQDAAYYGSGITAFEYLYAPFFWHVFAIAVLAYTWIYIVMWSAAEVSAHSTGALIRTLFLMFLPFLLVAKYWRKSSEFSLDVVVTLTVIVWGLYALCYLLLLRLRSVSNVWLKVVALLNRFRLKTPDTSGREMQLVLRQPRPWSYAIFIVVIALGLLTTKKLSHVGLPIFTVLSVVPGGLIANIPANARALWLRKAWSREQLFNHVEIVVWRSAGMSVAFLVGGALLAGMRADVSLSLVVCGSLHIAVTTAAIIYLGLIPAANRRAMDALIAIVTLLIAIQAAGASSVGWGGLPIITALLIVLTVGYRFIAKHRWLQLDWMLCKPLRAS